MDSLNEIKLCPHAWSQVNFIQACNFGQRPHSASARHKCMQFTTELQHAWSPSKQCSTYITRSIWMRSHLSSQFQTTKSRMFFYLGVTIGHSTLPTPYNKVVLSSLFYLNLNTAPQYMHAWTPINTTGKHPIIRLPVTKEIWLHLST